MTDVQTSFDLRSAGERDPSIESPSYPFKRTPMDDVIETAERNSESFNFALWAFEANR